MILLNMDEEGIIKHRHDTSGISYDFQVEHDMDINPIVQSKDSFFQRINQHPFYKNVNAEGVTLYDAA